MDHKLISNILILSTILAFSAFLAAGFYTNFFDAFGILAGTGWGCLNFFFLKKLLQEWLKIDSRDFLKFYTMIAIKFPLLYLIGYGVLRWKLFPILNLLLGFSLIFIAIFMLGIGTFFSSKRVSLN